MIYVILWEFEGFRNGEVVDDHDYLVTSDRDHALRHLAVGTVGEPGVVIEIDLSERPHLRECPSDSAIMLARRYANGHVVYTTTQL